MDIVNDAENDIDVCFRDDKQRLPCLQVAAELNVFGVLLHPVVEEKLAKLVAVDPVELGQQSLEPPPIRLLRHP